MGSLIFKFVSDKVTNLLGAFLKIKRTNKSKQLCKKNTLFKTFMYA